MINKIIDYCAHNKMIVFLFIGMALFGGIYSMQHIPLDAIPDLSETKRGRDAIFRLAEWTTSADHFAINKEFSSNG